MTQTDLTKLAFEISNNLAALNSKFDSVMAKLADHEARLHQLEHTNQVENDQNFKLEILKLLAKTVTISIVVLGSVVGAGGALSKLFNFLN